MTSEEIVEAVDAMREWTRRLTDREVWIVAQYVDFLEKRVREREDRLRMW